MSNNMISESSLIKWFKSDRQIVHFLHNVSTDWHHHPCIQLSISLHDEPLELETIGKNNIGFGFIIQSNIPHKLSCKGICCMSLLVSPDDRNYHLLSHFIENNPLYALSREQVLTLAPYLLTAFTLQGSIDVACLCELLGDSSQSCICRQDNRIIKATSIISSLPVKQISSREIADKIYLSESRFLHLFRSKLGVNFRGYLLWQRLQDVLNKFDSPVTFTTLANDMGFADSAHFSRTCLSSYGLRPSELKRAITYTDVMCDGQNFCFYDRFKAHHQCELPPQCDKTIQSLATSDGGQPLNVTQCQPLGLKDMYVN